MRCLQSKQQQKATTERLTALQMEVRGMSHDLDGRIESLRNEVSQQLKQQSTMLGSLLKQHAELIESLRNENKELKDEVERLRRF